MSEAQTQAPRRSAKHEEQAHAAQHGANITDAAAARALYEPLAPKFDPKNPIAFGTIARRIGKDGDPLAVDVNLPIRFVGGMVMTDHMAAVLQRAYGTQFNSTMAANIKNRAERYAKATTDKDRADNRPWSAAELEAAFVEYEIDVGRTGASADTIREQAAWQAFVKMLKEHNDCITVGATSTVWPNATGLRTAFPADMKDDEAKAVMRARIIKTILDKADYAARVQTEIDAIMLQREARKAQKGSAKAEASSALSDL